jgi:hypothetical protein
MKDASREYGSFKLELSHPLGFVRPGRWRFFYTALNQLRDERRYRVFADLERLVGRFPHAIWHSPKGPREVVIWCSNDYLSMALQPSVVGAMIEAASRMGTGAGTNHPLIKLATAHYWMVLMCAGSQGHASSGMDSDQTPS